MAVCVCVRVISTITIYRILTSIIISVEFFVWALCRS